jgi:hypothetical protein
MTRSQRDRHETHGRSGHLLHEGQLYLDRVLKLMSCDVSLQTWIGLHQFSAEFFVNVHLTERCMPGAGFHNRQRRAETGVIRAQNDVPQRKLDPRVNGSRNMSGIHVTGVRHNDPDNL